MVSSEKPLVTDNIIILLPEILELVEIFLLGQLVFGEGDGVLQTRGGVRPHIRQRLVGLQEGKPARQRVINELWESIPEQTDPVPMTSFQSRGEGVAAG